MTKLNRNALGRTALTVGDIAAIYADTIAPDVTAECWETARVARRLCESHERLRAELQGCEVLLTEAEAACRDALGFVQHALEYWDWRRFPYTQERAEELRAALVKVVGETQPQQPLAKGGQL